MQAIEYSGLWWLPSNAENKVPGTLSFSNEDGTVLSLIGAFRDFGNLNLSESHPLVLGISRDGKKITLINSVATGVKVAVPGFVTETYQSSFCLVGGHFEESSALRFRKLAVRYSHLPDWVRISGFRVSKYLNEPKVEVIYSCPEDLTATTSKGTVSVSFAGNTTGDAIEEVNLRQTVSLEVEANAEFDLQDLVNEYIRPLQNFLTLATTHANTIDELNVYSKQIYFEKQDKEKVDTPVQLFFQQEYFAVKQTKLLIPDYMLFALSDIQDRFQSIIESWFNISSELDSVCDLLFGIQYTPDMYAENKFLNAVQAVESYHRRRMNNEVQPKADHKAQVNTILSKVDPNHVQWLKLKLEHSNEPHLEHRIRELLSKVNGVLAPILKDEERFAKKVKYTRHYLTHFDQRLKQKAAKGAELFWLTEKLSYLVRACLLLELGMSTEECGRLIQRNQSFIFASGQATQ